MGVKMKILNYILALLLSVAFCATFTATKTQKTINYTSKEINGLKSQINALEKRVAVSVDLKGIDELVKLTRENEWLRQENADLKEQIKLSGNWWKE